MSPRSSVSRRHHRSKRSRTSLPRTPPSRSVERMGRRLRSVQLARIRSLSLTSRNRASSAHRTGPNRQAYLVDEVTSLPAGDPVAFDLREDAVIVDALVVKRVDPEPGNAWVLIETLGDIAHHVFDKDRIVVRLHRKPTF